MEMMRIEADLQEKDRKEEEERLKKLRFKVCLACQEECLKIDMPML
mgnify:CR=1 FL=1